MKTDPQRPADGGDRPAPAPAPVRERRSDQPRRVRHGVRLRHREGVISHTPLSQSWLDRLHALVTEVEEWDEGHRYARLGQTKSLELRPGEVVAQVQGIQPQPCTVRIAVPVYATSRWDAIIDDMAKEAVYLVKLVDGELPEGTEGLLARHEEALVPTVFAATDLACSCSEGPASCRHVATVAHLVAEVVSANPLVLFALRGMEAARLVDRLRHARAIRAHGIASAHVDPMIPESQREPRPLIECVDDYWRHDAGLARLDDMAPPHHVNHGLLRRLGPSPLPGRFPLVGLLASIYDTVAEDARRTLAQAEGDEPSGDAGIDEEE